MGPPREMPLSRVFFYTLLGALKKKTKKQDLLIKQNFTFLSKSPIKEPPLHVPPVGHLWRERCSLSRAIGLFIHSYLSLRVPS
jgi:hypothetical protein